MKRRTAEIKFHFAFKFEKLLITPPYEEIFLKGKMDGGSEFQSLEVIWMNKLAIALVRLVSNKIVKGCWVFENRVFHGNEAFGWIIDFISSVHMPYMVVSKIRERAGTVLWGSRERQILVIYLNRFETALFTKTKATSLFFRWVLKIIEKNIYNPNKIYNFFWTEK